MPPSPTRVLIFDTTLRDGEQSPGASMNLEQKVSVMIFPEGTRSRDGELKPFKDGAFRLAIDNQVPILPLAVNGAYTALVKGDWRFGVSHAEVRVLEPISTEGLTKADLQDLKQRTWDVIAAAVHDMRGTS